MAMDFIGLEPRTIEGVSFTMNRWAWLPLVEFVHQVAPQVHGLFDLTKNDGFRLSYEHTTELAYLLTRAHVYGTLENFMMASRAVIEGLPDERCELCEGRQVELDFIRGELRMIQTVLNNYRRDFRTGTCNCCKGRGSRRPWSTLYSFTEWDYSGFVIFLCGCGGCQIN